MFSWVSSFLRPLVVYSMRFSPMVLGNTIPIYVTRVSAGLLGLVGVGLIVDDDNYYEGRPEGGREWEGGRVGGDGGRREWGGGRVGGEGGGRDWGGGRVGGGGGGRDWGGGRVGGGGGGRDWGGGRVGGGGGGRDWGEGRFRGERGGRDWGVGRAESERGGRDSGEGRLRGERGGRDWGGGRGEGERQGRESGGERGGGTRGDKDSVGGSGGGERNRGQGSSICRRLGALFRRLTGNSAHTVRPFSGDSGGGSSGGERADKRRGRGNRDRGGEGGSRWRRSVSLFRHVTGRSAQTVRSAATRLASGVRLISRHFEYSLTALLESAAFHSYAGSDYYFTLIARTAVVGGVLGIILDIGFGELMRQCCGTHGPDSPGGNSEMIRLNMCEHYLMSYYETRTREQIIPVIKRVAPKQLSSFSPNENVPPVNRNVPSPVGNDQLLSERSEEVGLTTGLSMSNYETPTRAPFVPVTNSVAPRQSRSFSPNENVPPVNRNVPSPVGNDQLLSERSEEVGLTTGLSMSNYETPTRAPFVPVTNSVAPRQSRSFSPNENVPPVNRNVPSPVGNDQLLSERSEEVGLTTGLLNAICSNFMAIGDQNNTPHVSAVVRGIEHLSEGFAMLRRGELWAYCVSEITSGLSSVWESLDTLYNRINAMMRRYDGSQARVLQQLLLSAQQHIDGLLTFLTMDTNEMCSMSGRVNVLRSICSHASLAISLLNNIRKILRANGIFV
ncbi:uncharacterized protein LOC133347814 [Lethenteron reissneri]|uniref:uncharacterized protein LOC133347814 n=1 Tax=Lethenteron reissneri TaxID=7753 RepID=UPI002AB715DC|nr:uncharacterized protein LOC133347814 [Lethenteron reissneri]XP_061416426.1 uncharacterized protein LOC133347814 [Lethenteron reissneri]XP_061416428.1 uncharacterized protein LOC133347814 [Lethenteron reissneri]XP_061416429.1 uncharacterized protein LOC133347814 [Lethenteron reissneri]XP_061416430.1 uncharacterized protein LOC133347814 [Lethenteron reissneri]XP_061416431.1 uncharacterized protein LOC133347814 [Lethenteron reissneri]